MIEPCPCKYCVAPERHAGCHSACDKYTKWNIKHQQELAKIRERNREDEEFLTSYLRNMKKRRKR